MSPEEEQRTGDIAATWTRELNDAVGELDEPLDGGEAWTILRAPKDQPVLPWLKTLRAEDFVRIADYANKFMEVSLFAPEQIARAVKETIWHWSNTEED